MNFRNRMLDSPFGIRMAAIAMCVALFSSCDSTVASTVSGGPQGGASEGGWVRAALQDQATNGCVVAVSDCSIDLEGWRYKALYRSASGEFEFIGFFAARVADVPAGCAIRSVWYAAPQGSEGRWSCEAFPDVSAACAAASLKARFGVPSQQDVLWDVGSLPMAGASGGGCDAHALSGGLLEGDALAGSIAPLDPEARSAILTALASIGYPAVETKPQVVEGDDQQRMLTELRTVFMSWITTPIAMQGADQYVVQSRGPDDAGVAAFVEAWHRSAPVEGSPCPPAWTSPWEPVSNDLCACETIGPIHHCEQVTYSASGEVEVVIPWPLPGTKVTLVGSANGTTAWSVCGWLRRCTGMARRTHTRFVPPECTIVQTDEFREITFERWGWWPIQKMPACEQTSCLNSPPSGMPPASEKCGLGTPVQPVP